MAWVQVTEEGAVEVVAGVRQTKVSDLSTQLHVKEQEYNQFAFLKRNFFALATKRQMFFCKKYLHYRNPSIGEMADVVYQLPDLIFFQALEKLHSGAM